MEGFGQYIFIAVIIIAFIISTVKESRKNRKKESGQPIIMPEEVDQTTSETSIEDWERWFSGEDKHNKPTSATNIPPKKDTYSSITKIKETQQPANTQQSKEKPSHERLGYEPKIKINSKEEARRAIIYSEIIRRKY